MEARKTTRREFLKQTLTACMGLLFLKSGFGKGQSPNDKLNIAIIGTGGCSYQSPNQSSQKTAVDDPLLQVPLLAGGTEPLRGSPREAGGTYGGGYS